MKNEAFTNIFKNQLSQCKTGKELQDTFLKITNKEEWKQLPKVLKDDLSEFGTLLEKLLTKNLPIDKLNNLINLAKNLY